MTLDNAFLTFYSTIPIAKRRYYGRVQQAVHDFLLMGPDVVKGDMTAAQIQFFFDPQGVVVVPAKRKDIGGVCTKKDNDCRGKEIRDSRYNDMVRTMYSASSIVMLTNLHGSNLFRLTLAESKHVLAGKCLPYRPTKAP